MKLFSKILSSIILMSLLTVGFASSIEAAPPQDFQTTQIIGAGLNGPSGFEIAPDGRIFVLERTGKIKIVKNGVLLSEPFADLPSVASGDRGLIGIAFDPEFGINNHYVYFYYTGLDLLNRLVRFDASSDVGTNGPYLIYQTNSPSQELHVGGSIRFGPDGKMYFAVGDNGYPPNAQNLGNPHGKILRINKDGSIPFDNPFYGQTGVLPEIWAYGLRNPWRFQFDSATGYLYGGDVGDYTWEEVNHLRRGQNYGWPTIEGVCNTLCGNAINPIYAYNHNGESAAVTGGPVYRATQFPEEYRGNLFFGDYAKGFIKRMVLSEAGSSLGVYDFDVNAGSVVDLKVGPDGSLYYITYYPGRLYKISYVTGNHAPTANATADNDNGVEPHTVNFSSAGTSDPDGDALTYLWDFGDGTTSTDANPTKTYYTKGTYTVELAVSDGENTSNAIPLVIQVGIPPTVTVGAPVEGDRYQAGDTINYTAHAIDSAGFDLNDGAIHTEILLHHATHIHPFLGPLVGRAGSFTIPDHGEAAADTWYEIRVTATDESGLSDTKSVNIYPYTANFTLQSEPAGLQVLLDGAPVTTPRTVEGVVNFKRELSVQIVQQMNGKFYQFERWSDAGAPRHTITTADEDTSYTAYFTEMPAFVGEYFNNTELSGQPALVRNDANINFLWNDGSPDPVIANDNFSVRWTKNQYFAGARYRFITATDDGVRLFVNNQLIIDSWGMGVSTNTAFVDLPSGNHAIRMEYLEGSGTANARLEWELAQDQPVTQPTTGFTGEYFNNITLSGQPSVTRQDASIAFNWEYGSPAPAIAIDNFSVRWTKVENITGGLYEFTATADDGIRILVDGELILDKWIDQAPTTYVVTKELLAGDHTIVVEYYEKGGGAQAAMQYVKIGDTEPTPVFTAEYFNNLTLTGPAVLTRTEQGINYDWGGGSPAPEVPNNNFSTRWTKTEQFTQGTYEFSVTGDDGVRLFVDGELILDKWIDQAPTTYKVNKDLTAGSHTIVMEYYEKSGGAVARLSYLKISDTPQPPTTGFSGEYFNNQTLTGPATLVRNDMTVDFDWGGGSPDPLINANNFSARWTKTETLTSGTYEFSVTGDDGIRLFVDGELLIDKFIDQGPTTYTASKALAAGNHTIIVEYYENGGGAVAKFSYLKTSDTPPQPENNYQAEYWNIPETEPYIPSFPTTPALLIREETEINNSWKGAAPAPGINADRFIARWTKTEHFEAGTYRFTTLSDDGVRVYVDNQLVIDQWNDHAATTHTGDMTLTAGDHVIKIEYFENYWDAILVFDYEQIDTPVVTESFSAEFFNNMTLTGTPVYTRSDNQINFTWGISAPNPLVNANHFSARWTKQKQYAAGTYTFTVQSDDGVRLWIDDVLLIDNWNDHALTIDTVTTTLTEGLHTVRVEYYDNYWDATIILQEE